MELLVAAAIGAALIAAAVIGFGVVAALPLRQGTVNVSLPSGAIRTRSRRTPFSASARRGRLR